jgi:hypothetical protein
MSVATPESPLPAAWNTTLALAASSDVAAAVASMIPRRAAARFAELAVLSVLLSVLVFVLVSAVVSVLIADGPFTLG